MTHAPRIGRVTLTVNDLPKMTAFYRDALGLNVLSADKAEAVLGTDVPLLALRSDPAARRPEMGEAGLYHTAFLLPDRQDLANWLLHAVQSRLSLAGASDHDVSEALYMQDPEGNGIEIYRDRPRDEWVWNDGVIRMGTYQLDLDGLVRSGRPWTGVPAGTTIGHVHLQVGGLPAAEEFWTDHKADITHRYRGATFFSWDGYHHHIGANTWHSRGAAPRSFPATGLAEVEILGLPPQAAEDPWGTPIRFVS
ncbi:VOC family protein [Falsirhodobacter sp. 1013]|uniref:VOC family protein n=1 Tax=Falsirhodobacter sp. 1013 TaxID=3417566 RepID=UPI003EBE8EC9